MNSNFKFELRDSFVVHVKLLQKMYTLLSDRIGKTSITVECADDVTREFESIATLIKYENIKSKRITNLRLTANSGDFNKYAFVEFTDKWYFGGTRIEIKARDDVVTRLRSDLLEIIAGVRPWYFVVNKIDVFIAAFFLYSVFVLWIMYCVATNGPTESSEVSPRVYWAAQLTVVGFSVLYLVCAYFIHRFRKLIFPHGAFAIGQEVQRINTLEKWRWSCLVAFFVSLVAGVLLLPLQ